MSARGKTKQLIIDKADELFYQQGFNHTSYADIAEVVNISRGNFYHHFKTKDEILTAVIAQRLRRTHNTIEQWEAMSEDPLDRVKAYFSFFTINQEKIKKFGCPMGTLSNEMAKLNHGAKSDSVEIFRIFRRWIAKQFQCMGFRNSEADALALHVISQSQGIATVYNAFEDDKFVKREVQRTLDWLDTLKPGHSARAL